MSKIKLGATITRPVTGTVTFTPVHPVPEPSTIALLLTGGPGVALGLWRRRLA